MFRISRIPSILFIIAYLAVTLFLRLQVEPQLGGNPLISMAIGAFGILFIWALMKSGILNPGWFDWENGAKKKISKA